MTRLQEIRSRLDGATPRPWCVESCGEKGDGAHMIGVAFAPGDDKAEHPLSGWLQPFDDDGKEIQYYRDEEVACCEHRSRNAGRNADLIANAPSDLAYLLDRVAVLEKALRELLLHACIADAAPEDVDAEDHARERAARAALKDQQP